MKNSFVFKVIDFRAHWRRERPFPMDMCSFAVNVKLFLENHEVKFDIDAVGGFQESSLLTKITTISKLEPKASNCTKVFLARLFCEDVMNFSLGLATFMVS
jgi:galactosylgalactosylxylosylprotein 3-beta-glucuronosyltransferase 3